MTAAAGSSSPTRSPSKPNPLTARVMVNRVWQHHFGDGFVSTPDDLGNQSAPPTHPELIDWLATRFMADGWSLKKLHKLILLSATWQQSSRNNPQFAEKDPFNRLLWRANIRRLEFEPLRDSILSIGGALDLTVGGHPIDLAAGTRQAQGRGRGGRGRGSAADLLPSDPRRYGLRLRRSRPTWRRCSTPSTSRVRTRRWASATRRSCRSRRCS